MALFNNVTRRYQHLPTGQPVVPPPVSYAPIQRAIEFAQKLFPDATRAQAIKYERESTTAAIVGNKNDTYATRLQRQWTSRSVSTQILPIVRPASISTPWPNETDFGPVQDPSGRDYPAKGVSPISARPIQRPIPSPYVATAQSRQDKKRRNLVPISGGQDPGLDFGPAPDRIPYMRRLTGISLMAGPAQFSTQQYYDNTSGAASNPGSTIIIAPPVWNNKTRGYRSASGILGRVQGGGRQRIPAVYVPQQAS